MGRERTVTPLGAVFVGAAAGAAGTAALDLVGFARYRRGEGRRGLVAWETAEGVDRGEEASAPGQVGRRIVQGFTQAALPPSWAVP